jgi:Ca2+-binding RTX toxin-like protein
VDRLTGGAGNDEFRIYSHADFRFYTPGHGSVSRLDGGDGDDTIRVGYARAPSGDVYDISGGDGDDSIEVYAATARNIAGGDGDDRIEVAAATIENVSGGRGDDDITLYNTRGGVSTIDLHEGDGNDTIEVNGPLEIRRFNADGTQQDLSTATVSTNEGEGITIRFAGSDDSVTVRYRGIAFGYELQPTSEGGLSITFRSVYWQSA